MELQFHEYANLFPLIEGREFDDLVADIQQHGIREPIWLYDGKILDGRNRYHASQAIGLHAPIKNYEGDDALAFVISLNLKRRHLNESQRAMVAARLAKMRQGARTDIEHNANLHEVSAAKAGEILNVSERTVKSAKTVQDRATPELIQAVEAGKVAVSAAAQATKIMTPEQQRQALTDGNLAKAVAEHRRAETKLKQAEEIIAAAPKFTPEQEAHIQATIGSREDGDIYSRIDEVIDLIKEQPSPDDAVSRIPETLGHAIDTTEIFKAAQWLLDFCTAWTAMKSAPINKLIEREYA